MKLLDTPTLSPRLVLEIILSCLSPYFSRQGLSIELRVTSMANFFRQFFFPANALTLFSKVDLDTHLTLCAIWESKSGSCSLHAMNFSL